MPSAATRMGLEIIIPGEVSHGEKGKYMISFICRIQKMIQMNSFTKQKQFQGHRKQTSSHQKGKEEREYLGAGD